MKNQINKEAIAAAIRLQCWTKYDYASAIEGMDSINYTRFTSRMYNYSIKEIKDLFWKLAETRFNMIERYTTFNGIQCYIELEEDKEENICTLSMEEVDTLDKLVDYINSGDGWDLEIKPIIGLNNWYSDFDKVFGVCNDGNRKVIIDHAGDAIIVSL